MKSSFLFLSLFTLMANAAFAQMSTRPSPKEIEADKKSTFTKFSERLRIGYFGVLTTPTFHDMARQNWEYAATSEETESYRVHRDSIPTNLWNQISFNYNFGAKMNFVFNPRFSIWPIGPKDTNQNPDNSFIQVEDFLIGFQGVVWASDDKKLNVWIRPGMRLSTSRGTRESGNRGYGTTTHQLELAYNPTYDFNKTWQFGVFGQVRQWTIDDRYNYTRLRFYQAPYFQYTLNDTTRVQWYYETMIENQRRWKTVGRKEDPKFENIWNNTYVGVSHDVNEKFNIFPFLGCFLDRRIDSQNLWIGAWISYQIK